MRTEEVIHSELLAFEHHARMYVHRLPHPGILPGGLNVLSPSFDMIMKPIDPSTYNSPQTWLEEINSVPLNPKWVSCFVLAVNEVNAALGSCSHSTNKRQRRCYSMF
jgi:L-serine dehydratase